MTQIVHLDAVQAEEHLPALIALLQDAVNSGASIGFLPPLSDADAATYWNGVVAGVANRSRVLLAAFEGDELAGSVQLELIGKPNSRHRAEVQKLIVHRAHRNRGIGRALMQAVEQAAIAGQRTLLVLDTRRGDTAEGLYSRMGYTLAGIIPRFVTNGAGELEDTVVFYRELTPGGE